jgi:opacity protein-like surface antigen
MGTMRFVSMIVIAAFAFAASTQAVAQDYPRVEVFTGYSYLRGNLDANFVGFDVSAAGNFNKWFGVVADFSHHHVGGPWGQVDSFLIGPRFTSRGTGRVNPYFHTLLGAVRVSRFGSGTAFGWALGGGVDVKVHKNIAIRVIDITYLLLRKDGFNSSNGRLSTGLVWRFGGK